MIEVNDFDGLDAFAEQHGWVEAMDEIPATQDALRMAEASGVDISLIPGTGKDGKVLIGDVRAFLEGN